MNNPKISVIMSVYNNDSCIRKSVESILKQTFENFEFIIVNDCSTDKSSEILKEYAKKDKRVRIMPNKKNIGLTKSLNKALDLAKGEYIARQDADDISLPERLRLQVSFLDSNPNVFLLGTNAFFFYKDKKFIKGTVCGIKNSRDRLLKRNYIIHSSIMFRRNPKMRYREKFYYSQDYDLYLNILSNGLNIDNIDVPLVGYGLNFEGISSKKRAAQKFFGDKATEFYHQRLKSGRDQYDLFDPEKELKSINNGFNGKKEEFENISFVIDLMVYLDKARAIKLIFTNLKSLSVDYVAKKLMLILLPKKMMKLQKDIRLQNDLF